MPNAWLPLTPPSPKRWFASFANSMKYCPRRPRQKRLAIRPTSSRGRWLRPTLEPLHAYEQVLRQMTRQTHTDDRCRTVSALHVQA